MEEEQKKEQIVIKPIVGDIITENIDSKNLDSTTTLTAEILVHQESNSEEPIENGTHRIITEEDVIRLNEQRWPNVNGVYDSQGEWHDWNDLTYSYSYDNSELIILPYTVCIINLPGQQYVTESSSN